MPLAEARRTSRRLPRRRAPARPRSVAPRRCSAPRRPSRRSACAVPSRRSWIKTPCRFAKANGSVRWLGAPSAGGAAAVASGVRCHRAARRSANRFRSALRATAASPADPASRIRRTGSSAICALHVLDVPIFRVRLEASVRGVPQDRRPDEHHEVGLAAIGFSRAEQPTQPGMRPKPGTRRSDSRSSSSMSPPSTRISPSLTNTCVVIVRVLVMRSAAPATPALKLEVSCSMSSFTPLPSLICGVIFRLVPTSSRWIV